MHRFRVLRAVRRTSASRLAQWSIPWLLYPVKSAGYSIRSIYMQMVALSCNMPGDPSHLTSNPRADAQLLSALKAALNASKTLSLLAWVQGEARTPI
ncbi:uncharacterized protein CIMG_10521 [Coccidioides immitis RS]|uniref:Uncharacterized protein n=1 Tax=Coccidioides immitis (strain RS) TaxID=246410 RepID=A0A0D8JVN3_COCIM|nr:uncharacterized protein CIMG_10521 [Coccidioides immitis RS]KJF60338.1 hypothetical protein CIMG_10521 [Coccidioides immitis RS]